MSRFQLIIVVALMAVAGLELPAAVAGAASPPGTWVAFYSSPGDYIGAGANQLFQPSSTVSIEASGSPAGIEVHIFGAHDFNLTFAPVQGTDLTVGTYVDAERTPFRSAGHPGIDIYGDGRGCNTQAGEFVIQDIAFVNGALTRLAIAFDQRCEGGTSALMGEARYNAPTSGPLTVQATTLLFPPAYVGVANASVPLWVTNPGSAPAAVGAVTTTGAGASDVAITSNTCPATLGAGATCVVTAKVTPRAAGARESTISIASGAAAATVRVLDTGIGGNAAFILDSEPGDWVGAGLQSNFNQFNSTISGGGTPGRVGMAVTSGSRWFYATISAPAGQSLAVGDYHDAQRAAFAEAGHPGIDVDGDGRGCNTISGQFTVREIVFDAGGRLAKFAADVEQHCEGGPTALFASFRLASTVGYSAISQAPGDSAIAFPTRVTGSVSDAAPVTIGNEGVLPLSVSPAITGPNAADFKVASSTCPAAGAVSPGASCTMTVTFTPHGVGVRAASLVITDNTPRGHRTISLTDGARSRPPLPIRSTARSTWTRPARSRGRTPTPRSRGSTWWPAPRPAAPTWSTPACCPRRSCRSRCPVCLRA